MTVALVGAGPGDPGLITVRGLELIRAAEILVYDRLVAHELVLENNRPTEFKIRALEFDVIHSFYVPQFRVKADAVPGQWNYTYATPDRIGTYTVICTELCGPGHSLMRAPVRVVSPTNFAAWLAREKSQQTQQGGA